VCSSKDVIVIKQKCTLYIIKYHLVGLNILKADRVSGILQGMCVMFILSMRLH